MTAFSFLFFSNFLHSKLLIFLQNIHFLIPYFFYFFQMNLDSIKLEAL